MDSQSDPPPVKKSFFYVFLSWLLGLGTTPSAAQGTPVQVIAHRGASAYAPENTLVAFEMAAAMRADWFELDCTLSKDGEVVVIHDDTLDRTTVLEGPVDTFDVKTLQKTDAGTWFDSRFSDARIPELGQALDLAREHEIGVYVEIKSYRDDSDAADVVLAVLEESEESFYDMKDHVLGLIRAEGTKNLQLTRRVVDEIRAKGLESEVVIQSFSPIVCAVALIEAPEVRTELLATSNDDNPDLWPWYLRWVDVLPVAGVNVNKKDLTADFIATLREKDRSVAVWTVNEPAEMRRFADMGVQAIITDAPDVCREVLETATESEPAESGA